MIQFWIFMDERTYHQSQVVYTENIIYFIIIIYYLWWVISLNNYSWNLSLYNILYFPRSSFIFAFHLKVNKHLEKWKKTTHIMQKLSLIMSLQVDRKKFINGKFFFTTVFVILSFSVYHTLFHWRIFTFLIRKKKTNKICIKCMTLPPFMFIQPLWVYSMAEQKISFLNDTREYIMKNTESINALRYKKWTLAYAIE